MLNCFLPTTALRFSSAVAAVACLVSGFAAPAAADDDPPIVIDDVPFGSTSTSTTDDTIVVSDDDDAIVVVDDDPVIVMGEDNAPMPTARAASGPLGRVWDAWHVAIDSEVIASAQRTDANDGPFRLLGSLWMESWLLPAPNLSVYGNAVGRLAWDATPAGRVTGFVDVYELYAKIGLERATVQLGRLVVPWGRTQAVGFGDRLQPSDLRRGGRFPDPVRQKQPQLGVQVKGALDVVGVEAIAFVTYEPTEGPMNATNQGGLRLGRYQTALVRSSAGAFGLLGDEDTSPLRPLQNQAEPTLALRAWRRLGEIDVTGSVAWHLDDTATLKLAPDVQRALANEAFIALGSAPATAPCNGSTALSCLGTNGALSSHRTTSVALDASWGLGLVVARAEGVWYPKVSDDGGKTALVVDDSGLHSVQVQHAAVAVAVEGQLGPFVDGSLEVFDVVYGDVPAGARVWGVEVLDPATDVSTTRMVHRLALGAALGGAVLDERVSWRVRGEAGLLQQDVLAAAEVRYLLPVFDLYVGVRGDLFAGRAGSPGWMREGASSLGVFLGEGS